MQGPEIGGCQSTRHTVNSSQSTHHQLTVTITTVIQRTWYR